MSEYHKFIDHANRTKNIYQILQILCTTGTEFEFVDQLMAAISLRIDELETLKTKSDYNNEILDQRISNLRCIMMVGNRLENLKIFT